MKPSQFNHSVVLENGDRLLYNFFSGKCIRLNAFTMDCYEHPELYGETHRHVLQLRKAGFLTDFDEIAHLGALVRARCGQSRRLSLVICPTLMCNFACPYCYETARGGRMTPETQDKVIAFSERLMRMGHPAEMQVTWYGGEPLLEPEIIQALSERLIALCEKYAITYNANMVTNGYHLTGPVVSMLKTCRITQIQVTLDGPNAQTHDATRHLRGGGGTFDRIMENISNPELPCHITVRCNVHSENAPFYGQLEERIKAFEKRVSVYPGYMDPDGSFIGKEMAYEDYSLLYCEHASEPNRLKYHGPYCKTPYAFNITVDERGNLYKCWEHVGVEPLIIGHIDSFDLTDPLSTSATLMTDYLNMAWPDEDAECMSCELLPACMGGCPIKRVRGMKQCIPEKYALDDYVLKVAKRRGLWQK